MLAVHVALSMVGIVCGLIVFVALAGGKDRRFPTHIFFLTTFLTDVTGFFLPKAGFNDPPTIVGLISLLFMLLSAIAYYQFHSAGRWRWIYILGAGLSFYLNAFVGVIQAFQKIPGLHAIAPAGSEPPFMAAQAAVVLFCLALAILALRRFHPNRQRKSAAQGPVDQMNDEF